MARDQSLRLINWAKTLSCVWGGSLEKTSTRALPTAASAVLPRASTVWRWSAAEAAAGSPATEEDPSLALGTARCAGSFGYVASAQRTIERARITVPARCTKSRARCVTEIASVFTPGSRYGGSSRIIGRIGPRSSVRLKIAATASAETVPRRYIESIVTPCRSSPPTRASGGTKAPISNV